jgi:hypothetical protein
MASDACCTRAGWTEYLAYHGAQELHVSVAPGTALDGDVRAFDHDAQEMVVLNGWMAEWTLIERR